MDERKLLFKQFLNDKNIYNLNVSYWRIKLQKALDEKISSQNQLIKNLNEKGKNFYDGNPMFSFYSKAKGKAIRVIQEDPVFVENYTDIKLIEAWITKIHVIGKENSEQEVPELVVSIFLTRNTVEKCVQLAREWFYGDLTKSNLKSRLI